MNFEQGLHIKSNKKGKNYKIRPLHQAKGIKKFVAFNGMPASFSLKGALNFFFYFQVCIYILTSA